jgi:Tol biopolymer transport system component
MRLSPGTRIGHYEVLTWIGAGGMGEVYRAKDTRLKRDVALKVLPEAFCGDAGRMARFEREAEVLAALNHPNIAVIYGVEAGAAAMELVEGPTLQDRIAGGAIPWDEALPIVTQILDALEYAHDRGIIHRDLKPANIKVTPEGRVKVLDFGLAKALHDEPVSGDPAASPTITMGPTLAGALLGTAAYMSPEQARGKPVDRRADIWGFGVLLYEMLTGAMAFSGETVTDMLAAVVKEEPSLDRLPPHLRPVVARCLRKDLRTRWRDIADVRIALEEAAAARQQPLAAAAPRRLYAWIAAAAVLGFALAFLTVALWPTSARTGPPLHAVRFQVPMPERHRFTGHVSISPDGRLVAFTAAAPDQNAQLWVRPLDSMEARPIPGTDNAGFIFWSPDSRFAAYWAAGKLKRVAVSGGQPETICDATFELGGTWRDDGLILIGSNISGIQAVKAGGGPLSSVTTLDVTKSEIYHAYPYFLPDGRHFLYRVVSDRPNVNGIYVAELDGSGRARNARRVASARSGAIYVPQDEVAGSGFLLYMVDQTLVGQPFDAKHYQVSGDAFLLAERVGAFLIRGFFGASQTGTLLYAPGREQGAQLTWFSSDGRTAAFGVAARSYADISLSPDGRFVAAVPDSAAGSLRDVWIMDPARGTNSRLTFGTSSSFNPVWSPDGKRIAYGRSAENAAAIYVRDAAGAGPEEMILRTQATVWPFDWSPDGNLILYGGSTASGKRELWVVPVRGDHQPRLYLPGEVNQTHAQFSPDGRFVAYDSAETGRSEIYVQQYPAAGGKWQISAQGGVQPRWRRDGKELFYIALDQQLMAVDVQTGPVFSNGLPRALFNTRLMGGSGGTSFRYAVSPDGRRFLVNALSGEGLGSEPITVVLNWRAGL